jgi:hypothetical protein
MKTRCALVALLATAGIAAAQNTGEGPRGGPVLNGDWFGDQIDDAGVASLFSPYEFTLDTPAYFRVTDQFIVGDTYFLTDATLGFLGQTTLNGAQAPTTNGTGLGEDGWRSADYGHFETILAPGNYSITLTGDGAGGLPAGMFIQLEKIPAPGAAALLGLGGLVATRRRR